MKYPTSRHENSSAKTLTSDHDKLENLVRCPPAKDNNYQEGSLAPAADASSQPTASTHYLTPSQFLSSTFTTSQSRAFPASSNYYHNNPDTSISNDPDYTLFMSQQGISGTSLPTAVQDARRATRQLYHYFDPHQYRQQQEARANINVNSRDTGVKKKKPTRKELEEFRKRKEERKKIRHRWLYE